MFFTFAVRYISHMVSAKNMGIHMCCHTVSDRAAATTWRKHAAERPTGTSYATLHPLSRTLVIIIVLFPQMKVTFFSLCKSSCHLLSSGIVNVKFILGVQKERKQVFTRFYTSTLTIDLNLLLHCDRGKGHTERE